VRWSWRRWIVSLLIVCAPAAPAALGAQLPTTVSAVVGVVEHETTLYGLSTRTEGPVFGGEVVVSPFHFTDIGLQVTAGTLSAATSGTSDQTYTDVRLSGSAQALPWLSFKLGFDARGYGEPLGTQRWLSVLAGAEAHVPLFDGAARAIFGLGLLPLVSVSQQQSPNFGVATTTGVQFLRAPLSGAVLFTFERYDFPNNGAFSRHDQVAMLGLQLGVHFPR
jgi:hypothetical protein